MSNVYQSPPIQSVTDENVIKKIHKIGKIVTTTNISLLAIVLLYILMYSLPQLDWIIWLIIPVLLVFWLSTVALSWITQGVTMGIITFISILIPIALLILFLLSYNSASKYVKEHHYRMNFWGGIKK